MKLVVEVVKEGPSKKAQAPPQRVARSKAVVGVDDTVNELVAVFGVATAVTVVFATNTPVPEYTAILVGGVVTVGALSVEGR